MRQLMLAIKLFAYMKTLIGFGMLMMKIPKESKAIFNISELISKLDLITESSLNVALCRVLIKL